MSPTANGRACRTAAQNASTVCPDRVRPEASTIVPLMISGIKVQIDDTRSDQEFLQDIQDGADFVPFSITYVSGFTYMGQAQIVGEVQYSSQDGIAELSLSGPGKATQQ